MIVDLIIMSVVLAALFLGSITDFKKREVPDWISYSMIAVGFGLRLIFSVVYNDWLYLLYGAIGFGVFLGIAYAMFYSGQWGGGDSKVLMGLGALLGLSISWHATLVSFVVNLLFIGAAYGVIFIIITAIIKKKMFIYGYKKMAHDKKVLNTNKALVIVCIALFLAILLIKDSAVRLPLLVLLLIFFITFYVWFFTKIVETYCLQKYVLPEQLTEGDWIIKEIKIEGKYICGPKDLGIEKKQIRKLMQLKAKGKIRKVLIKEGVPFVPSFFIAYVVTLIFGNIVLLFIH